MMMQSLQRFSTMHRATCCGYGRPPQAHGRVQNPAVHAVLPANMHASMWSGSSAAASQKLQALGTAAAAAAGGASTRDLEEEEQQQEGDARDFAVALAQVADATKAADITVLHVAPLVSWTSYMVICTVNSRPQLLAVKARMEDAAVDDWQRTKQNIDSSSQWSVLDFGDVVAHIFTPEQRDYYGLDEFYGVAEEVSLPFVSSSSSRAPTAAPGSAAHKGGPVWSKNM